VNRESRRYDSRLGRQLALGEQVALAISRHPASDPKHRLGTLVVNFGGPGDPGAETLRMGGLTGFPAEIRARFVPDVPDDYLPLDLAAKRLGCARQTVLHKVQRGELHAVQVIKGRPEFRCCSPQLDCLTNDDREEGSVMGRARERIVKRLRRQRPERGAPARSGRRWRAPRPTPAARGE